MFPDTELARRNMVENQVRTWDVLDHRVLEVLGTVPREVFVPEAWRDLAFADFPIPLADGESMMKPVVEGRLLQALELDGSEDVLEIGTGTGFLAACLGQLAARVTSVEYRADFADAAQRRLAAVGADNVEVVVDEAVLAWQPTRRHDVLVVGGAVAAFPPRWTAWLKPGGRAFAVIGHPPSMHAVLLHAGNDGELSRRQLFETDLPYLRHAAPAPVFAL